jgi:DNA-binding NtrC family response regulator
MKSRILITDDDAGIRKMVRVCLEPTYEVTEAGNGLEALDAIRTSAPHVVLLDLAMPRMDGMTLLAEIHQMRKDPPIRVIVMTAHGSVPTAIKALRLGASDFLEKPFVPEDVRLSIASVLDEKRAAEPEEGFDEVLGYVRKALLDGRFAAAEALLMKAGLIADDDPAFLNLAGVLHESHGRTESARRFYEKSAGKDRSYKPASENLHRLGEIRRTGKSSRKVCLGEEVSPNQSHKGVS